MRTAIDASARSAIEQLIHEHAWLIDQGRADEVPDLYTDDGRMIGVGPDKVGRDAIALWAQERAAQRERRSRHVQTNIRLEADASDRVRGTVVLTLYRHDGPGSGSSAPLLVAEYRDTYRLCADHVWRFEERRLATVFGP